MAREYTDLAIEAQEIIADMPARHADVLREFIEAIHRRRLEGAIPVEVRHVEDGLFMLLNADGHRIDGDDFDGHAYLVKRNPNSTGG